MSQSERNETADILFGSALEEEDDEDEDFRPPEGEGEAGGLISEDAIWLRTRTKNPMKDVSLDDLLKKSFEDMDMLFGAGSKNQEDDVYQRFLRGEDIPEIPNDDEYVDEGDGDRTDAEEYRPGRVSKKELKFLEKETTLFLSPPSPPFISQEGPPRQALEKSVPSQKPLPEKLAIPVPKPSKPKKKRKRKPRKKAKPKKTAITPELSTKWVQQTAFTDEQWKMLIDQTHVSVQLLLQTLAVASNLDREFRKVKRMNGHLPKKFVMIQEAFCVARGNLAKLWEHAVYNSQTFGGESILRTPLIKEYERKGCKPPKSIPEFHTDYASFLDKKYGVEENNAIRPRGVNTRMVFTSGENRLLGIALKAYGINGTDNDMPKIIQWHRIQAEYLTPYTIKQLQNKVKNLRRRERTWNKIFGGEKENAVPSLTQPFKRILGSGSRKPVNLTPKNIDDLVSFVNHLRAENGGRENEVMWERISLQFFRLPVQYLRQTYLNAIASRQIPILPFQSNLTPYPLQLLPAFPLPIATLVATPVGHASTAVQGVKLVGAKLVGAAQRSGQMHTAVVSTEVQPMREPEPEPEPVYEPDISLPIPPCEERKRTQAPKAKKESRKSKKIAKNVNNSAAIEKERLSQKEISLPSIKSLSPRHSKESLQRDISLPFVSSARLDPTPQPPVQILHKFTQNKTIVPNENPPKPFSRNLEIPNGNPRGLGPDSGKSSNRNVIVGMESRGSQKTESLTLGEAILESRETVKTPDVSLLPTPAASLLPPPPDSKNEIGGEFLPSPARTFARDDSGFRVTANTGDNSRLKSDSHSQLSLSFISNQLTSSSNPNPSPPPSPGLRISRKFGKSSRGSRKTLLPPKPVNLLGGSLNARDGNSRFLVDGTSGSGVPPSPAKARKGVSQPKGRQGVGVPQRDKKRDTPDLEVITHKFFNPKTQKPIQITVTKPTEVKNFRVSGSTESKTLVASGSREITESKSFLAEGDSNSLPFIALNLDKSLPFSTTDPRHDPLFKLLSPSRISGGISGNLDRSLPAIPPGITEEPPVNPREVSRNFRHSLLPFPNGIPGESPPNPGIPGESRANPGISRESQANPEVAPGNSVLSPSRLARMSPSGLAESPQRLWAVKSRQAGSPGLHMALKTRDGVGRRVNQVSPVSSVGKTLNKDDVQGFTSFFPLARMTQTEQNISTRDLEKLASGALGRTEEEGRGGCEKKTSKNKRIKSKGKRKRVSKTAKPKTKPKITEDIRPQSQAVGGFGGRPAPLFVLPTQNSRSKEMPLDMLEQDSPLKEQLSSGSGGQQHVSTTSVTPALARIIEHLDLQDPNPTSTPNPPAGTERPSESSGLRPLSGERDLQMSPSLTPPPSSPFPSPPSAQKCPLAQSMARTQRGGEVDGSGRAACCAWNRKDDKAMYSLARKHGHPSKWPSNEVAIHLKAKWSSHELNERCQYLIRLSRKRRKHVQSSQLKRSST